MNIESIYPKEQYKWSEYFLKTVKPVGAVETIENNGSIIYNGATKKHGRIELISGTANNNAVTIAFPEMKFKIEEWSKVTVEFLGIQPSINNRDLMTFSAGVDNWANEYIVWRRSYDNQHLNATSARAGMLSSVAPVRSFGYRHDLSFEIKPSQLITKIYGAERGVITSNIPVGAVLYPFLTVRNLEATGGLAKTLKCDGIVVTFEP